MEVGERRRGDEERARQAREVRRPEKGKVGRDGDGNGCGFRHKKHRRLPPAPSPSSCSSSGGDGGCGLTGLLIGHSRRGLGPLFPSSSSSLSPASLAKGLKASLIAFSKGSYPLLPAFTDAAVAAVAAVVSRRGTTQLPLCYPNWYFQFHSSTAAALSSARSSSYAVAVDGETQLPHVSPAAVRLLLLQLRPCFCSCCCFYSLAGSSDKIHAHTSLCTTCSGKGLSQKVNG